MGVTLMYIQFSSNIVHMIVGIDCYKSDTQGRANRHVNGTPLDRRAQKEWTDANGLQGIRATKGCLQWSAAGY